MFSLEAKYKIGCDLVNPAKKGLICLTHLPFYIFREALISNTSMLLVDSKALEFHSPSDK